MADLIIPSGYANVTARMLVSGSTRYKTVNFGVSTAGGPLSIQDACDQVTEAMVGTDSLFDQPMLSSISTMAEVYMLRRSLAGLEATTTSVQQVGTRADSAAIPPPNVSVSLRKKTSFVGKAQRGRMYLPNLYLNENSVDNIGAVAGFSVTSINNAGAVLLQELEDLDMPMVLLHSASDNTPDPITSLSVAPFIATQRRRVGF